MNASVASLRLPGPSAGGRLLTVRDVEGPAEMAACIALYERVMGLRSGDGSLNLRLLTALQHNSGLVLGAFLDGEPVGFTYSFLARGHDRGRQLLYQYSQLAVVARELQGTGVGRLLKLGQRERCLAEGTTLMRWAYDPVQTRNGHFNLDVLGAVVETFTPAMYGTEGFGDATGDTTDRFIVTWRLEGAAPPPPARPLPPPPPYGHRVGDVRTAGEDRFVVLPDDWQRHRAEVGPAAAAEDRARLTGTFTRLLADRVADSCVRLGDGYAAYRFRPTPPTLP
ncbi:hypothetical protein [Streptomyces sp. NPDC060194]|uniref:hypothetical protein n=1 Tax=Streptomyces sp. NPDC060194 TaxID=3347069 RepID=UPI0036664AFB